VEAAGAGVTGRTAAPDGDPPPGRRRIRPARADGPAGPEPPDQDEEIAQPAAAAAAGSRAETSAGKETRMPNSGSATAPKTAAASRRAPRGSAGSVRGVYIPVAPATLGRLRLLTVGPVELNLDGMAVRVGGRQVHMAPKEFELLAVLMQNAGRLLTRRQLLDAVWGEGYPDRNKTLDVHIRRLRRHLEADPEALARMRTVRGLGYVYDIGD
jgi:hypothetical protein